MRRVLIVEDEVTLRASMVRGLGKLPDLELLEAGTVAEAVKQLETHPPQLILSDIDLPDRTGIELLGEMGRLGLRVPIVFVSAYLQAYRAQVPPHADVELRQKPLSLEDLREVVRRKLGLQTMPPPAPFGLVDYFQLACMGRRSVEILVRGNSQGRVVVVDGEAWSAVDGTGEGTAAFRRLMFAENSQVTCLTLRTAPGIRNISRRWEELLLDSAREEDEALRNSVRQSATPTSAHSVSTDAPSVIPPTSPSALSQPVLRAVPVQPDPEPTDEEPEPPPPTPEQLAFQEAWDRGIHALLRKNYPEALSAFMDAKAIQPDNRSVMANLDRLKTLGYPEP